MNVAINTLAHRDPGGGITYLQNVLPRLEKNNNDYFVLVPEGRDALRDLSSESIHLVRVRFPVQNPFLYMFYEQIVLPVKLYRLDADIDVLFCPGDTAPLLSTVPAVLAVRNLNPYSSAGLRTFDIFNKFKFRVQRLITYFSVLAASHTFFVSDFSRRKCSCYLPLLPNNTSVIHHGIDQAKFSLNSSDAERNLCDYNLVDNNYILYVSTLNEHKNAETLIQAFGSLDSEVRNQYDLLIVGRKNSPEYVGKLNTLIKECDIQQSVHLVGEVDYDEIELVYQHAAIYVHPAVVESFGHPVVEAMATGTPVIASNVAAIPEIAGDAGLYFNPHDVTELSSAIFQLLANPEKKKELAQKSAHRADEFSWDNHVEELNRLFAEVSQS